MSSYTVDAEFNCEVVVVLVEDTLFPVIRSVFNDSAVFQDMFSIPAPPDMPADGSSKDLPLRLEGITKDDFRNFLRMFLPARSHYSSSNAPTLDKNAWISVLRLAEQWQMPLVREDAVSHLTALLTDPTEKLDLSDKYNVPAWSIPALVQLVNRDEPLSEGDLTKIGLPRGLKVAALRERNLRSQLAAVPKTTSCPYGHPTYPASAPVVQLTEDQAKTEFDL